MKKIVSFFVFAFLAFSASAQFEKGSYLLLKPSINFGGASIKINGSNTHADTRMGYGLGVELINVVNKNVFFAAGASLNSRGYKNVRTLYLDVPLSVNYMTNPITLMWPNQRILFGAGVYGGLALTGKYKNSVGSWTTIKFGESSTDNRSLLDGGFLINLGTTDEDFGALYLSLMFGLKNVIPKDRIVNDDFIKLNTLNISWALPLKKLTGKKN